MDCPKLLACNFHLKLPARTIYGQPGAKEFAEDTTSLWQVGEMGAIALQDLDLAIEYRSGRSNNNAAALSRKPPVQRPDASLYDIVDCNVVIDHALLYSLGAVDLRYQQLEDPDCQPVMSYLEQGQLPDNDVAARKIMLESTTFELEDGMLFWLMPDKTLWTVVPHGARRQLFNEVHKGMYMEPISKLRRFTPFSHGTTGGQL